MSEVQETVVNFDVLSLIRIFDNLTGFFDFTVKKLTFLPLI